MKRHLILINFIFLFFFQFSLLSKEQEKEVDLKVKNVLYGEKALEIEFAIKNLSKNDIWVCASDYYPEMPFSRETPVLRTIEKVGGWIKLEFISLTMASLSNVSFEGIPIWAKYKRLKSGETFNRKIILTNPITEENEDKYSFMKPCKNTILSSEIKRIQMVVGYHKIPLNTIPECCKRKNDKSDICEVTILCARKNTEELIYTKIVKEGSVALTSEQEP